MPDPVSDTMVERVARILEPQAWGTLGIGDTLAYRNRRTSSLRKSRAAIAAMRSPTSAMRKAGNDLFYGSGADEIFAAMINAALSGPTEGA